VIKSKKIKTALYIKKGKGNFSLLSKFLFGQIFLRNKILKQKRYLIDEFRSETENMNFSELWFDNNIPFWFYVLEKKKLFNKKIKGLEIGSFEGRSSYFLLNNLKNLNLDCIDTWEGSKEQVNQNWNTVEKNFDENMSQFKGRYNKFKSKSFDWYNSNKDKINYYDFVYIDGSHYFKDVLLDAQSSWNLLKNGGLMIFDDYLWNFYDNNEENPIFGINQFLKEIKNQFKILYVDTQLFLEKK